MRTSRRGAAALEFALCMPLTLLLAAGIVDLGRAISFRHVLQRASRDAARVGAAMTTTEAGAAAGEAEIEGAAADHAVAALEAVLPDCGTDCTVEARWYTAADGEEYLEVIVAAPQLQVFGIVPGLGTLLTNRFTVMTRVQE